MNCDVPENLRSKDVERVRVFMLDNVKETLYNPDGYALLFTVRSINLFCIPSLKTLQFSHNSRGRYCEVKCTN